MQRLCFRAWPANLPLLLTGLAVQRKNRTREGRLERFRWAVGTPGA